VAQYLACGVRQCGEARVAAVGALAQVDVRPKRRTRRQVRKIIGKNQVMRRIRLLLLASCLSALAALPGSAWAKSDSTLLGFADDLGPITRGAPGVAGTSQLARITVSYPSARDDGWAAVDAAVAAARASGQRLFFTATGLQAPTDLSDWGAFLQELRARYPDLWGVQAWNEPNLERIGGNLTVQQSVAIVEAARQALPGVRLVGPSVSPTVPGAADYQHQLYAALPDDIGVGINIYTYRRRSAVKDVRANYRRAKRDGGGADVYVTEMGFTAAKFKNQARASAQAFEVLRQKGAATAIFYRLLTDHASTIAWEQTGKFAVLNDDLSPTRILIRLHRALSTPVDIDRPKLSLGDIEIDRDTGRVEVRFSAKDDFTRKDRIDVRCALDKRKPAPCSSPQVYEHVSYGPHHLHVTATDKTGNEARKVVSFKVRKPSD
jgi:hypothetical protein